MRHFSGVALQISVVVSIVQCLMWKLVLLWLPAMEKKTVHLNFQSEILEDFISNLDLVL